MEVFNYVGKYQSCMIHKKLTSRIDLLGETQQAEVAALVTAEARDLDVVVHEIWVCGHIVVLWTGNAQRLSDSCAMTARDRLGCGV